MIMGRFRRRAAASAPASPEPGHENAAATASASSPARGGSSRRRHAIFYDVENTSSPDDVEGIVAQLALDRAGCDTQLVAVGNWRVIGQQTARLLARYGAELVHSAPSTGVRDWSDLRIAVDAGIWLAGAKPGDMLHIISDDQAFDAVGDVAASLGVEFTRIARREQRKAAAARAEAAGGSRRAEGERASARVRVATQQEILDVARRLAANDSRGDGVTLDALSNALKDAGFRRAPGSLRLITRLKRIKELQVSPDGTIRAEQRQSLEPAEAPVEGEESEAGKTRRRTRRGRRGGRRRGARQQNGSAEEPVGAIADPPPSG
jgi:hypothetical protein